MLSTVLPPLSLELRDPLRLLGLAALALSAAACGQPPLEPASPSDGAPHFLVMSYNIEFDAAGEPTTLGAIGESGADVVALQEVTPEAEAALREMYGETYPYQIYHSKGGAGGLAALSRHPLIDRGLMAGPGGWHPAWHVEVELPALRLMLLNVHLRSLFSGNAGPVRSLFGTHSDHLRQIADFSSQCDPGMSNLVLGDFNEEEGGGAVQYLEERGYDNVLPQFRPGQPTWRFRSVGDQLEATIDHILYDETLRPLNAWVERKGKSDHLPVLAHFEPYSW